MWILSFHHFYLLSRFLYVHYSLFLCSLLIAPLFYSHRAYFTRKLVLGGHSRVNKIYSPQNGLQFETVNSTTRDDDFLFLFCPQLYSSSVTVSFSLFFPLTLQLSHFAARLLPCSSICGLLPMLVQSSTLQVILCFQDLH